MVREMNAGRKCVGNGMHHLLDGKTCEFCVPPDGHYAGNEKDTRKKEKEQLHCIIQFLFLF
jgi:hypothetical protein